MAVDNALAATPVTHTVQLHYYCHMKPPHELCYCQAARGGARLLSRLYDRHLAPAGINIQQLTILSMIRHKPGMLIAELASHMVMERTTLLRALKPLQRAGFVESEAAGMGRSLALAVSRRGQQMVRDAFPLWQNAQAEVEMLFGIRKANSLRKALREVSALA